MFSTKSVNSLKSLFASYHEPLPLSKQQSQKLLNGLKSSFRKQLELEHGRSPNSPEASSKSETDILDRHSAASRHLKDILSNPLFSYKKDANLRVPSTMSVPGRDPMEVFDHAVARGMMTTKAAIGCMVAKRKQLESLATLDTLTEAEANVAPRVVRWLKSSSAGKDLQFLDDQLFIRTLTPFLVDEGIEEVAWSWLAQTINGQDNSLTKEVRLKRASELLSGLVRAKCQPKYGNLDSAISTMLQAQSMFRDSPLLSDLLVYSWRLVSWFSTVEFYSRTAPSEELFEAHLATADRLPRPFLMERAHLHLYHPTHPDYVPALQFFKNTERLRKQVQVMYSKNRKLGRMSVLPWLTFLGQDTVNSLTQSGRTEEAQSITRVLRDEIATPFNNMLEPNLQPAMG